MNTLACLCTMFLLMLLVTLTTHSQYEECGTIIDPDDPNYAIDLNQQGGIFITAEDTLRVLLVFVQFPDDDNYHPFWPAHEPPSNMAQYIDINASINSTNFSNVTNYFRQMSGELYIVVGDTIFVEAPHESSYYQGNRFAANKDVLQNAVDQRVDFGNYDRWTRLDNYTHQKSSNGVVDMIYVVWRGFQWHLGEASMGGSGNDSISVDGVRIKFGYPVGSGLHCSFPYNHWPEKLLQTMVHEKGHWLLGSSHPYGGTPSYAHWSILGQQFNAGVCTNAYERERLAWIVTYPVTFDENIPLDDFISSGIAYKYHPANGEQGEYYWIENHQKESVYDDATTNPNDKGIWILHQRGVYNNTARLRSRPSDGFWTWDNPSYSTQCLSQSLPVFAKSSVNRITGLSYRDQLPITAPPYYDWMHVFKDVNNVLHCGGFFRGDEFYGAFNTTISSIYSRWSSPATGTWTNQLDTSFAMEAKTQLGSAITVRFYDTPIDAPPSKPQNMKFTYHSIGGGSSYPKLTWTANVEPDVNPGGYYLIERRLRELPSNWTSWTEIASVSGSTTEFIDDGITLGPTRGSDSLQYRMRVKDSQLKLSTHTEVPPIRCDLTINPPHKPFVGNVLPAQFELGQSYPNPFNPSTQIRFDLPEASNVTLVIYDLLGRQIAELAKGEYEAGYHSVTWNASSFASGVYLARFVATDGAGALRFSTMQKLLLTK